MRTTLRQIRSNEEGIALILTMFMVLLVSLLGAAVMVSARTETLSSMNYRTMAQARYGAESGVHRAIHFLLYGYSKPGTVADPLNAYTLTQRPVIYAGKPVVLSSTAPASANYPVAAVQTAFNADVQGSLTVSNAVVSYSATARLLAMRQFTDAMSGAPTTLMTWHITGTGTIPGSTSSSVEVSAVIEQTTVPMFRYAAFATAPGCDALQVGGGGHTNSYDSRNALSGGSPTISDSDGDVGTNGNLGQHGNNAIHGTLSTPRTGVGGCSAGNVTAYEGDDVDGGLIQLPQAVSFPTPPVPDPLPPTTSFDFGKNDGCPAGVSYCTVSTDGATITPPSASTVVTMGNVSLGSGAEIHLSAGIYVVNSLKMNGNATLIIDSGPVIIKVAGTGESTPIDLNGGSVSNPSFVSSNLQFQYAGNGELKFAGGTANAALIYAPNATARMRGNSDFYGSIVAATVDASGGVGIHYDRALDSSGFTAGNPVMSEFTWKAF